LGVGCLAAGTGAAAALVVAAEHPAGIDAIVTRSGLPDLASAALGAVRAPTLLIVGGSDVPSVGRHLEVLAQLGTHGRLEIVRGATHRFVEPGALEEVAGLACRWFERHLAAAETERLAAFP